MITCHHVAKIDIRPKLIIANINHVYTISSTDNNTNYSKVHTLYRRGSVQYFELNYSFGVQI